jgi:hypothetical protein
LIHDDDDFGSWDHRDTHIFFNEREKYLFIVLFEKKLSGGVMWWK